MKFSINDFCSKYDQIRWNLRIWLHIQKKSLMEKDKDLFCSECLYIRHLPQSQSVFMKKDKGLR